MPELPEVETVRRGLALKMTGRKIVAAELRRQDLRRPFPPMLARTLTGAAIGKLTRRGKYILIELDDNGTLLLHLGMSGRITAGPADVPHAPHDHVVLTLDDGTVVRFNDARRFGLLDYMRRGEEAAHPLLAEMGPEPLEPGFDGKYLAQRLAGKMTPIKAALLDQKIVAGLGNIYVCEALYRAGISPRRLAATVTGARAGKLATAIKATLSDAIEAGGSSLRDYVQADGELGYFQHQWAVYGHEGEPCPGCTCKEGVRRIVQSGRSTFFCAKKQR
ncbi:MAG TPA: bifunctional DNA-formamidopyrimidine glycosylase/DNA-(apurinic or apyrimidinic site) lyase [Stellaceae bacterium]|jgi:formamidopyrimidine-DNA glycosylase|nr:bifunctional DNA-formamidopyrimidine glycosylase/DNA-(apurinic or apyrimidinic site) lyase [Stellaceae bacterium]